MTGRETALHGQSALPCEFLQRHLRTRADVLDHFGGCERAELAALLERQVARQAIQEAGSEEVAGAGGVHGFPDRRRPRWDWVRWRPHHATFLAAGDHAKIDVV